VSSRDVEDALEELLENDNDSDTDNGDDFFNDDN
jgi:hypothetical protein